MRAGEGSPGAPGQFEHLVYRGAAAGRPTVSPGESAPRCPADRHQV